MVDILYFLELVIPELSEALGTIGAITLIFGLANAFFGYKLFRAMLGLIGFLVGAFAGGMVFIRTQSIFSEREVFWVYILIGGFIGSALAELFHHLGVFLVTGAMGAVAGFMITQSSEGALVIGGIVGIISVCLEKYAIIISTAISGGSLAALGIEFMRLAEGEYRNARAIGWLIAVCGIVVQLLVECVAGKMIPGMAAAEGTGGDNGVRGENAVISPKSGFGEKSNLNANENNKTENNTTENNTGENNRTENSKKGDCIRGINVKGSTKSEKAVRKNLYCGKCGAKLPENARFCGKCGAEQYISVNG